MKTIICGGRDYFLTDDDFLFLDSMKDQITEVVSGCARGADSCGELWANKNNIPIKPFPAKWKVNGVLDRAAGIKRNCLMAQYAEQCVVFSGGNGTRHMKSEAEKRGLNVIVR